MKKFYLRSMSLLLAVILLVVCGCSCGKRETSSDASAVIIGSQIEEYEDVTNSNGDGASSRTDNNQKGGNIVSGNSGGSGGGSGGVPASNADEFLKKMPQNLRGTTLTYFYWWDPYTQMEGDTIKAFTKKTGIKVKTEVGSYSTFTTELAAKIAAGNSPDIVRLLSNALYQVKALQPVTNSGYDFSDDIWWKKLMKDYTFNGKTYAVNIRPKDTAILDTTLVYYNKRALRAAGLEDPYNLWKKSPEKWTWAKLWSMCEEFLAANGNKPDYYGVTFQYTNAYVRMFGAANYDYNSKTGKWENGLTNPEFAKRWSEYISLSQKRFTTIEHNGDAYQRAKILFNISGPFAARKKDQTQATLKERKEMGTVPLPTDTPYQLLYEYTAFGIPQGAKNIAAVPYYLRYVLDKSSYDLNEVYYDAQARDAVDFTMTFADDKYFFGENDIATLTYSLINGSPDQVNSTVASYVGMVDGICEGVNGQLGYLSD